MRKQKRAHLPVQVTEPFTPRNCSLLANQVVWYPPGTLKPFPDNPRKHPQKQLAALFKNIRRFGFIKPIVIDEFATILFGHAVWLASRELGLGTVPTVALTGLRDEEKRALVIADNKIAEGAEWDPALLKLQFLEILNLDLEVDLTGFSTCEVDLMLQSPESTPEIDDLPPIAGPAVSKIGDVWILDRHRLVCGDATSSGPFLKLLGEERAEMIITDPPYNVKIQGHARGRSKIKHREFAMASGEMSSFAFRGFLGEAMRQAVASSTDGSIHYWFIDWRHLPDLLAPAMGIYSEWKNLIVWRKSNAGQGSFYRSHHELVPVFKAGNAPHINNFGLGGEGRFRTNVLDYPGGSNLDATRQDELAMHPTVKPVALIADLMRDCSRRNGLVLDLFGGSGTALLAAEETGRRARVVELDPLYVDLGIRRWQKLTGSKAIHEASGQSFDDRAQELIRG